jgi:hypothetical protein
MVQGASDWRILYNIIHHQKQQTMLEQLFNLVKEHAGDSVVNNPDVPNEHNEAVMATATSSITNVLQNALAGGGLESVMQLLSGKGAQGSNGIMSNPLVQMMAGGLIKKLVGNFGLNGNQASNVASGIIPNVLNSLINRTNDPNNSSFDIGGILNSLTGGAASQAGGGGLANIISQFTGGGGGQQQQDAGGGGLADIIKMIGGGAAQNIQQQQSSGGLFDLIKGFMK